MTLLLLPFTVFVAYSADKGDLQKRLGELDAVIDAIEEKIDDGLHVAEELVEKGEATTRKLADASGLTKLADETGLTAAVGLIDHQIAGLLSDDAAPMASDEAEEAKEKGHELSRLMTAWELDAVRGARRRFKVELDVGESYVDFKPWQVASILQGNIKRMSVKRAAHAVAWVGQQKTRADYRMQASHVMMGEPTQVASNMLIASGKQELLEQATTSSEERWVGFASHGVVCLESDGAVTVNVVRRGDITSHLRVDYFTRDGTATGGAANINGADFQHVKGTLVFEPYESQLAITVTIYSDYAVEDDETFQVVLVNPVDGKLGDASGGGASQVSRRHGLTGKTGFKLLPTRLGEDKVEVTIMDDDSGGTLGFVQTDPAKGAVFTVVESAGQACVSVRRRGNPGQNMSCKFRTFRGSAKPGLAGQKGSEYEITYEWAAGGLDGELLFGPGEMIKDILIDVFDSESYYKSEVFYVQLVGPQNCELRNLTVGQVTITHDPAVQIFAMNVVLQLAKNAKATQLPNRYRAKHRVQVRSDFDPTSLVVTELEVNHEIDALESRLTDDGRVRVRFAEYKGPKGWCSVTAADGDVLLVPISAKKKRALLKENMANAAALDNDPEDEEAASGQPQAGGGGGGGGGGERGGRGDSRAVTAAESEKQTVGMCILRSALLPWRIVCTWTPPPSKMGGWPCFAAVLGLISAVTVIICELAGLFACAVGLENSTVRRQKRSPPFFFFFFFFFFSVSYHLMRKQPIHPDRLGTTTADKPD